MGKHIKLESAAGTIDAYLAEPAGTPKGGVVVIQEIFGVNGHIRDVTDRYAQLGYTAIAPAFFDHVEKGVELDYDDTGIEKGRDLVEALGIDKPMDDVKAAAKYIEGAGKIGTVGFCWGGTAAYLSAIRLGLPSVSYYGGRNTQYVDEKAQAPVMFHYGEKDKHITAEDRRKVHAANPDAPLFVYPADHGFNCDRRGSYDAESSRIARERTFKFFDKYLAEK